MIHCLFPCKTQKYPSLSFTKYLIQPPENIIINDEYTDLPEQNRLSFSYPSFHKVKTAETTHHHLDLTQPMQGIRSFPSLRMSNMELTKQPSHKKGLNSIKTTILHRKTRTLSDIMCYLKENSF